MSVQIRGQWQYVENGETLSIEECRKLKPVDTYLWGDVFYHLYQRESDGKLFIYSEWYSCERASEGYFQRYCNLSDKPAVVSQVN